MVVDIAVVDDVVGIDRRHLAVRELGEDLARRRGRPTKGRELPLQPEQPLQGPVGGRLHHPVLQVVDVVADPVEDREVAVDDRVRQGVEEVVGSLLEGVLHAEPERCRRRRAEGAVMDAQEVALPEDEVDLRRRRLALVVEREQDDVDDVLVERFDLRALVPLGDVLGDQGMEPEGVGHDPDLVLARRDEVDPEAGVRRPKETGDVADVGRFARPAVVAGDDPHGTGRTGAELVGGPVRGLVGRPLRGLVWGCPPGAAVRAGSSTRARPRHPDCSCLPLRPSRPRRTRSTRR